MDNTDRTIISPSEAKETGVRSWSSCQKLAKKMREVYEEAGRDPQELSLNFRAIERRGGVIDRSMDLLLGEEVVLRHREYLKHKRSEDQKQAQSCYYKASVLFSAWSAVQLAACGAFNSALESAGKAVGYLAANRALLESDDWVGALEEAAKSEYSFLEEWSSNPEQSKTRMARILSTV